MSERLRKLCELDEATKLTGQSDFEQFFNKAAEAGTTNELVLAHPHSGREMPVLEFHISSCTGSGVALRPPLILAPPSGPD